MNQKYHKTMETIDDTIRILIVAGMCTLFVKGANATISKLVYTPPVTYIIEKGDNYNTFKGRINLDTLKVLNPNYDFSKMHVGDTIYISR